MTVLRGNDERAQHDETMIRHGEEEPEVGTKEWRDKYANIQRELDRCLDSLATQRPRTPEEIFEIVDSLNAVYEHVNFRHRYSEIIGIVHKYDEDDELDVAKKASMAMSRGDTLASSLREFLVHDCEKEGCGPDCAIHKLQQWPSFMKLYDHANLEAKRAGYDYSRAQGIISEIRMAQEDLKDANKRIEKAQQELNKAQKSAKKALRQAKRLQTETVSVLGVFSAIILAFNASVTFSTSSIAAVDATPPFNVAFIVSIVGLMLFNCLYGAFALIYRIVRPENSSDTLLAPDRVAGIELCAVSCAVYLGTLTYFNGYNGSGWELLTLGIATLLLIGGIEVIWRSYDDGSKSQER